MVSARSDAHFRVHPRVDAALILLHSRFVLDLSRRSTSRDEVAGLQLVALRRNRREAAELVQHRDDATAELLDFGERVRLATVIDGNQQVTDRETRLWRREVPGFHRVVLPQQLEELVEYD